MIGIGMLNGLLFSAVFCDVASSNYHNDIALEVPSERWTLNQLNAYYEKVKDNHKFEASYGGLCFFACLDAYITPSLF